MLLDIVTYITKKIHRYCNYVLELTDKPNSFYNILGRSSVIYEDVTPIISLECFVSCSNACVFLLEQDINKRNGNIINNFIIFF